MTNGQMWFFVALIGGLMWAAADSNALENCEKLHSRETCMHEIYNGN